MLRITLDKRKTVYMLEILPDHNCVVMRSKSLYALNLKTFLNSKMFDLVDNGCSKET